MFERKRKPQSQLEEELSETKKELEKIKQKLTQHQQINNLINEVQQKQRASERELLAKLLTINETTPKSRIPEYLALIAQQNEELVTTYDTMENILRSAKRALDLQSQIQEEEEEARGIIDSGLVIKIAKGEIVDHGQIKRHLDKRLLVRLKDSEDRIRNLDEKISKLISNKISEILSVSVNISKDLKRTPFAVYNLNGNLIYESKKFGKYLKDNVGKIPVAIGEGLLTEDRSANIFGKEVYLRRIKISGSDYFIAGLKKYIPNIKKNPRKQRLIERIEKYQSRILAELEQNLRTTLN